MDAVKPHPLQICDIFCLKMAYTGALLMHDACSSRRFTRELSTN